MADKKAKKLTVEALKHGDSKRKNIDGGVLVIGSVWFSCKRRRQPVNRRNGKTLELTKTSVIRPEKNPPVP